MKNNETPPVLFLLPGLCYLAEYIFWKSLPQTLMVNGLLGGLWTLGQIGILFILASLYRYKIANGNGWRMVGVSVTALGAVAYCINYIFGYWLHLNTKLFLPLGALLSGIGMVITGIQVLKAGKWKSNFRFTPLIVGLYPFTVMFLIVLITGHPSLAVILCWGIPWLLLGIGMILSQENSSGPWDRLIRIQDISHIL